MIFEGEGLVLAKDQRGEVRPLRAAENAHPQQVSSVRPSLLQLQSRKKNIQIEQIQICHQKDKHLQKSPIFLSLTML